MIVVCDSKSRSQFIIADNSDRYICSIPIKIKQGPHAHQYTPKNQQKQIYVYKNCNSRISISKKLSRINYEKFFIKLYFSIKLK